MGRNDSWCILFWKTRESSTPPTPLILESEMKDYYVMFCLVLFWWKFKFLAMRNITLYSVLSWWVLWVLLELRALLEGGFYRKYSVIHNSIAPSKELCSKMAQGEVGVSLPWWCHALVLLPPGYWGLFSNLIIFS